MNHHFLEMHHKEKRGALLLVVLLILIQALPYFYQLIWPLPKVSHKKDWEEADRFLNELVPDEPSYQEKKYVYTGYKKNSKERTDERQNEPTKKIKAFAFDPNTADSMTFAEMGLAPKTIKGILNFRKKGAQFKIKSDFSKIYQLDEAIYQQLEPFIQLPDSIIKKPLLQAPPRWKEIYAIEINSATLDDWDQLPGIGPSLAQRILAQKEKLGGFVQMEQLTEIYAFPDSTFEKIKPYISCDNKNIQKLSLNQSSMDDFKKHPYLRWKHVNAIMKFRKEEGKFKKIEELRTLMEFNDAEGSYWKIKPYLNL